MEGFMRAEGSLKFIVYRCVFWEGGGCQKVDPGFTAVSGFWPRRESQGGRLAGAKILCSLIGGFWVSFLFG